MAVVTLRVVFSPGADLRIRTELEAKHPELDKCLVIVVAAAVHVAAAAAAAGLQDRRSLLLTGMGGRRFGLRSSGREEFALDRCCRPGRSGVDILGLYFKVLSTIFSHALNYFSHALNFVLFFKRP